MALSLPVAVAALAFVSALPVVAFARRSRTATLDWATIRRGLIFNWLVWLAVVAFVITVGSPADAGFGLPGVGPLIDGALFGFVAFAGPMVVVGLLARVAGVSTAGRGSLVVLEQPVYRRLAVAVTGAVVETTLFYGVAVAAVGALGGGPGLSGVVAAAGLLLVRARWGARQALQWIPGAIALAWIVLSAGSVLPAIAVRLLYDALVLVSSDREDYERGSAAIE